MVHASRATAHCWTAASPRKFCDACLRFHEAMNAADLRRRRDDRGGTRRIRQHSLAHAAEGAAKEVMVTPADDHEVCLYLRGALVEHSAGPPSSMTVSKSAPVSNSGRHQSSIKADARSCAVAQA
jgi:hypothetical protein